MISPPCDAYRSGAAVVATARVTQQDSTFTGSIDLRLMPVPLQDCSKNTTRSSIPTCLVSSTIEEQIETLHLKAVFADGHEQCSTTCRSIPARRKCHSRW